MPVENVTEPPKRHMPRHGRPAPRTEAVAPFIVDRAIIDALPSFLHKAIAKKLVSEGKWVVKDAENKGSAE